MSEVQSIELRECRKCKQLIPIDKFRIKRRVCRSCGNKEWMESYRRRKADWPSQSRERINAYHRKRSKDPEIKKRLKEYANKYRGKDRIGYLIKTARHRARKANIEIDEPSMRILADAKPEKCECCKQPFDYTIGTRDRSRPKWLSPSFDRIDVSKGYVAGNVAVICWRCNAIKRDGSIKDFENILAYMRFHIEGSNSGPTNCI